MTIIEIATSIIFKLIIAIVITVLVNKLNFFNNFEKNSEKAKGKKMIILGVWIYSILSMPILKLMFGMHLGGMSAFDYMGCIGLIIVIIGMILIIKANKNNNIKKDTEEVQDNIDKLENQLELNQNETLILNEKFTNLKNVKKIFTIIGMGLAVIFFFIWKGMMIRGYSYYTYRVSEYENLKEAYPTYFDYEGKDIILGIFLSVAIVALFYVIGIVVKNLLANIKLTVTNKRVFGCTAFGKRVDLPIDAVAAVGLGKIFHSVIITTASGAIKFSFLSRYQLFHKEISKLLIERQNKASAVSTPIQRTDNSTSNADELKKFKELLDMGVITQEEFDQKKKQLLGL